MAYGPKPEQDLESLKPTRDRVPVEEHGDDHHGDSGHPREHLQGLPDQSF